MDAVTFRDVPIINASMPPLSTTEINEVGNIWNFSLVGQFQISIDVQGRHDTEQYVNFGINYTVPMRRAYSLDGNTYFYVPCPMKHVTLKPTNTFSLLNF